MPFGPYINMSDCISKNQDVEDPGAYCAQIHFDSTGEWPSQKESHRHADFNRILSEFNKYYCKGTQSCEKGESEYYQWLHALNLDETLGYGSAYESFRWAKSMLQYLRETKEKKYYKVLLGFPVKSMNGNVYKERDLIAAALTLKGIHPSLNHKNEWHFKPGSRWGEITAEDARYEDGAIEVVLGVSKSAVCPICNGKPMTELIDSKRIVNVSLQGGCANSQIGGVCDGFQFDDKGFSLLTSDVLPGIPMARIFPLEQLMVEALQKVDETKTIRRKRLRIKTKVIEQAEEPEKDEHGCVVGKQRWDADAEKCVPLPPEEQMEPCPEGQVRNPETGECEPKKEQAEPTIQQKIADYEKQIKALQDQLYGKEDPEVSAKIDILYAKKQALLDKIAASEQATTPEDCGEGKIWDPKSGECVPEPPKIEPSAEQVATVDITPKEPKPTMEPDQEGQCEPGYRLNALGKCVQTEECGEGRHWDAAANEGEGGCVDDTPPRPKHPETSVGTPAGPRERKVHTLSLYGRKEDVLTDGPTEVPSAGEQPPVVHGTPPKKMPDEAPPVPEAEPLAPLTPSKEPPFEPDSAKELEPKDAHDCGQDHHWDEDSGQCVPDEVLTDVALPTLEAIMGRRKAERTAKTLKDQLNEADKHYGVLYKSYQQQKGRLEAYKQTNSKLEKQIDGYNVAKVTDEVAIRDKTRRLEDLTVARDDYKHQLEKLKTEYESTSRKYQSTLATNLELSRKLTESHEDYLKLASKVELLEASLKKTRVLAKKQLKIRVK